MLMQVNRHKYGQNVSGLDQQPKQKQTLTQTAKVNTDR